MWKCHRICIIIATVIIVAASGLWLYFAWQRNQDIIASEALTLTQSLGVVLPTDYITLLAGNSEDLERAEYITMKRSLTKLVVTTPSAHYAYILSERDGSLKYLLDSEMPESPDYSPPGQLFENLGDTDEALLRAGESVITNPTPDRKGVWIRTLVPVTDLSDGRIVAVLGFDYSASEWNLQLWEQIIPDVIIVFCLLIVIIALAETRYQGASLKELNKKLSYSEAMYRSVFKNAPIGIAFVSDMNFGLPEVGVMSINPMCEQILGRTGKEIENINWTEITHPVDLQADLKKFEQFTAKEISGYSIEKRFLRPDGTSVWTNMTISLLMDSPFEQPVHLCLLEDITVRKEADMLLEESERSKSVLLSHLPGLAYRCAYDSEWTMEFVSEGCQALTGYTPESLINNRDLSYNDLISPEYRDLVRNEFDTILSRKKGIKYEYEIITKASERKWVLELGEGIYDISGNVEALEGIVIDITELKKRETEIAYLKERDLMTGLYNRMYLEYEKKRLDQPECWPLSVAICDIDGLRMINNAYGYEEGSRLIIEVARLILSSCRSGDVLGRTGGDEFTLLMPHTNNEQARNLVSQIRYTIEEFNRTRNKGRYDISLSIGYSTKDSGEYSLEDALKAANDFLNRRKLLNLKSSHHATLSSILATLYAKSQETEEHGQRIADLAISVGRSLALRQAELDNLVLLSMLHDIGKIGVNDYILNKPGKLTAQEYEQMKEHSEIGYRIAMSISELNHIADYILHHHEHWDGLGYPSGLKGPEIPLLARILAVVDSYDAMTEHRVYRDAKDWESAVEEILRCAGTQFDPEIARVFANIIRAQKNTPTQQSFTT